MADISLVPTKIPAIDKEGTAGAVRTKYLNRAKPGIVLFRYRGQNIARLPSDESSAEFAAAYDALLAEVLAGDHGKKPGKMGRPRAMFKPKLDKPVAVIDGRKVYRPPMLGWVIDAWLASDYFYPAARATERTYHEGTQRAYRYALAVMRDAPVIEGLDRPFGESNFTKMGPRAVRLYIEAVRRKYGGSTASTHRKLLKLLWKFARTLHQINIDDKPNPVPDVDDPYVVRERPDENGVLQRGHLPWPLDVQERFKALCNPDHLLVFHLLLSTGQRISDIMAMQWPQFDGTHLHVTSIKTGVSASRRVPSDLLDMLKRKREERTALTICTNRDGRPFGECAVWSAFKRVLVKIGAPQLTVHGLRKTAAKLLAEQGASVEQIMVLGGWKSAETARYYVQLAGNKRIAASADDLMDAALARQSAEAAERRRAGLYVVGGSAK
jgi:integrase